MSLRLNPKCKVRAQFCKLVKREIAAAIRKLKAGKIHQTRSGIKRLRALLDLLHFSADRRAVLGCKKRLRHAAQTLSEARDIEVCLTTLDALANATDVRPTPSAAIIQRARNAIAVPRSPQEQLETTLGDLKGVQQAMSGWKPDVNWKAVRRAMERCYRKARRAWRIASRHNVKNGAADPEAMHALRKRVKMFWTQLRVTCSCDSEAAKTLTDNAEALGDLLGRGHDLVILKTRLDNADGGFAPLQKAIEQRRARLDSKAMALAARFFSHPPGDLIKRVFAG